MNSAQFKQNLKARQTALKGYVNSVFPSRAGNMVLRFVNGNFRAQGWQGSSFSKWKPNLRKGTILVKKGALRRGTNFTTQPGQAHVYNNVKYAKVHNEGFNGSVNIPAHTRRNLQAAKVETGRLTKSGRKQTKTVHTVKSVSTVKAHTRKMNIPKRQFMPTSLTDSPVLAKAIKREIERELKKIFPN